MKKFFDVKTVSPLVLFLQAALLLTFAILLIVNIEAVISAIRFVAAGALVVLGISHCAGLFASKKRIQGIGILAAFTAAAVGLVIFTQLVNSTVSVILGVWFFIIGLARTTVCVQAVAEKLSGKIRYGFSAVLAMGFGLLLIFQPNMHLDTVGLISGIYLIIYSVGLVIDGLSELLLFGKVGASLKRRVRIPLPLFLAALLPGKVIDEFNKYFESEHKNETGNVIHQKGRAESVGKPQLEVYIHLSKDGMGRVGHVDLRFDDRVYSYGCYDLKAHKFAGMVSDGTFAIIPAEKYMDYCTEIEGKVVVGFGLTLNKRQYKAVQQKLEGMSRNLVSWRSDFELAKLGRIDGKDFSDPASLLVEHTGAKIYKLRSGKFKVYYALSTNCVMLADEIIGSAGLDILSVNGIITPGVYYSMLNDLFGYKNSIVTERNFYRPEKLHKENS